MVTDGITTDRASPYAKRRTI